jgi:hypothetical protein
MPTTGESEARIMTLPRTYIAWLAALAVVSIGCDDDDDDGRPRYRAQVTVDTGTPVSTLGNDELERICRSYDVYVDTYVSFDQIAYIACLPLAIVTGDNERDCEQELDSCMANFPEPIEVQAQVRDTEVCYSSLSGCRASVADLEGCINVNLDLALDIIDNWSCSGAGDDDLRARAAEAMDTGSACADIDAVCNDFANLGPD